MRATPAFAVIAALFALAGAYHLFGLFSPALVAPSPPWRHALFVAINAAGAALMLKRPPWMIYPFAVLTAQQLYGHGQRARLWWSEGRIDWLSLGVMLVLPCALYFIWADGRRPGARDA